MDDLRELFELTATIAADFYETLPDRPVYPRATVAELHAALSAPLPERGLPARTVIAELAAAADPGLVAEASDDAHTDAALAAVQQGGEAWMSGTVWDGRPAIRISVSNWQTSDEGVERTLAAFRALAPA